MKTAKRKDSAKRKTARRALRQGTAHQDSPQGVKTARRALRQGEARQDSPQGNR